MRLRLNPTLIVVSLIAAVSITLFGASKAEEQDGFCISCHTVPEQTYFDRARADPPPDLSSAHYHLSEGFRCIDCHRGDGGWRHRALTLALGARDAAIFFSGGADPAIEKKTTAAPTLPNAACVKCHAEALLVAGFENHFHNKLPAAYEAWQAGGRLTVPPDYPDAEFTELTRSDTSVSCTDCHRAHVHLEGAESQQYLDIEGDVYPACVICHRQAGQGPLELGP
jgi:nitrate/TMAO reductase-like tetraheme cytochrome c subunit